MNTTNVAITEEHHSSVIPTSHKELHRDLILKGSAHLHGSGYGNNISVEAGNIIVEHGLFAYSDLTVVLEDKASQSTIYSNLYAQKSVLVSAKSGGILRVCGSIIAEDINVANTIVYGSILGDRVRLKNSFVLGNAIAQDTMSAEDSLLGSFIGVDVELKNNVNLIEPYGIAKKNISISSPIGCYTLNNQLHKKSKYFLTQDDVDEISGFEEDKPDVVYKVLSASNRYLKPGMITERLRRIEKEFEYLFDAIESKDLENVSKLEEPFWGIINNSS